MNDNSGWVFLKKDPPSMFMGVDCSSRAVHVVLVNNDETVARVNQLVFTRGGERMPLEYNIDTLEKNIFSKKNLLGYQWYHIPELNILNLKSRDLNFYNDYSTNYLCKILLYIHYNSILKVIDLILL